MASSDFELPPKAQALVDQVAGLAAEVERLKSEAREDLEAIRKRGEKEVSEFAHQIDARRRELEKFDRLTKRDRQALEEIVRSRTAASERVADAWAEYERALAEAEAVALERKSHPAYSAAEEVRKKGKQVAEARRQAKVAEYLVELYEGHFPWLTELRDVEEEQSFIEGAEAPPVTDRPASDDPASHWLTKEEWQAHSPADRSQRALERYLRSRKTPWQVGRDYERYVGYLREQAGFAVTYHGIAKGLEDLGRDVIAEKDGVIEVIQCKRWAQAKTIHEKHVFQLHGTVVLAQIENPGKQVTGMFTTTTSLSPKAKEVADYLGIKVEEGFPLDDYPRIKCNVARGSGERIYHLPFDQQYDSTVIETERGERYVFTAAEAEELGFRRAWRWRGDAS